MEHVYDGVEHGAPQNDDVPASQFDRDCDKEAASPRTMLDWEPQDEVGHSDQRNVDVHIAAAPPTMLNHPKPIPEHTIHPSSVTSSRVSTPVSDVSSLRGRIKNFYDRFGGLLDIPLVFVFDIILYVMDVGSDIAAAVHHFRAGHPVWGALAITFVVLPALFWAAVSWTWWYYVPTPSDESDEPAERNTWCGCAVTIKRERRIRMLLALLLLDPLIT